MLCSLMRWPSRYLIRSLYVIPYLVQSMDASSTLCLKDRFERWVKFRTHRSPLPEEIHAIMDGWLADRRFIYWSPTRIHGSLPTYDSWRFWSLPAEVESESYNEIPGLLPTTACSHLLWPFWDCGSSSFAPTSTPQHALLASVTITRMPMLATDFGISLHWWTLWDKHLFARLLWAKFNQPTLTIYCEVLTPRCLAYRTSSGRDDEQPWNIVCLEFSLRNRRTVNTWTWKTSPLSFPQSFQPAVPWKASRACLELFTTF